ncbi:MAG TPA: MFS transporter [Novosphingobium sp.]|nr:MFS transporter [Novosphingobium sp.]
MTQRQKTFALFTLLTALVLEIVDLTIVNTALPAIKLSLHSNAEQSQWVVAGYSLSFAILLMAGGRLGDSFGYRRVFLWGVAGFGIASLCCGLAQTADQLVWARMLQGATGALMAPQFMALIQVMFDPIERIGKLAFFGLVGGLASIAGPILGGMLVEADIMDLGWRSVFLINLPVSVTAIVCGLIFLPDARSTRAPGYDLRGMGLFAAAVGAVLWPLIRAAESGWTYASAGLCLLSAPLASAGWRHVGKRERAGRPALFDPEVFSVQSFRIGVCISVIFSAASAGFLLVFAFSLQTEQGFSPFVTGMLHMPYGIGAMLGISVIGRKLLMKYGRWVIFWGALIMAANAFVVLTFIGTLKLNWIAYVPFTMLAGTGMGMVTGSGNTVTLAQVDRAHAGAASSLVKTCQQFGSAGGIALIGSAYFSAAESHVLAPSLLAATAIAMCLVTTALLAGRLPSQIFVVRPV